MKGYSVEFFVLNASTVSLRNVEVPSCNVEVSSCYVEVSSYYEEYQHKAVEAFHSFC